jgi:hypothetical protein
MFISLKNRLNGSIFRRQVGPLLAGANNITMYFVLISFQTEDFLLAIEGLDLFFLSIFTRKKIILKNLLSPTSCFSLNLRRSME